MRIQRILSNFTANGQVGLWMRHDQYETPFDLTLGVEFGSGLAGTLAIDYAVGNFGPDWMYQVFITQATTVITVQDNGPPPPAGSGVGHGLAVGDIVNLQGTPGGSVDGIYTVATVPSASTYTLTAGISQTIVGANCQAASALLFTSAASGLVNVAPFTARTAVQVTAPIFASRLHVTAFTTGGIATLVGIQGGVSS